MRLQHMHHSRFRPIIGRLERLPQTGLVRPKCNAQAGLKSPPFRFAYGLDRQNRGMKSTMIGKISSRPIIISTVNSNLAWGLKLV